MGNSTFVFGAQSRKDIPFQIGEYTFFSKPLTVREELPLAEVGDAYDEAEGDIRVFIREQADALLPILQRRVQGEVMLSQQWVLDHVGVDTLPGLLELLKTGKRPSGPVALTNWDEQPIVINGREFHMRRLSFSEQANFNDAPDQKELRATINFGVNTLAGLLERRALDGQPVTADWLLDHLSSDEIGAVTSLLLGGPEVADPNASSTPQADAVAESGTSAA